MNAATMRKSGMPKRGIGRCEYCRRAVYLTDFQRGLARWEEERSYTGWKDILVHTYDCEQAPRRLTRRA